MCKRDARRKQDASHVSPTLSGISYTAEKSVDTKICRLGSDWVISGRKSRQVRTVPGQGDLGCSVEGLGVQVILV